MALALGGGLSRFGQNVNSGSPLNELGGVMTQGIQAKNIDKRQKQLMQWMAEALNPATTSELKMGQKGLNFTLDPNSEMYKTLLQGTGSGGPWEGMAPPLGTPPPTSSAPSARFYLCGFALPRPTARRAGRPGRTTRPRP